MIFIKSFFKFLPLWLAVAALLMACSPQKRLNRILNRNPELKEDKTVVLFDTVKLKGSKIDTVINLNIVKDTIVLRHDSIITKVFFYKDKDANKAFISTENRPRQIIKKFSVTVPQIIYKYDDQKRWTFFFIGGLVFVLFLIVVAVLIFIYAPKRF